MRIYKTEVDLTVNSVKPVVYSGCKRPSREARDQGAIAVVNGTFYSSSCVSRNLVKVDGELLTTNQIRRAGSAALLVDQQGRVSMRKTGRDENPEEAYHAMGGFPQLVSGSEIEISPLETTGFFRSRHPRTAVGVMDENTLVLVVADGRSSSSGGLSMQELAEYMKSIGAKSAMNLDGGGSSMMWLREEGVVNRPSDGSERRVSDGLGIF